MRFGGIDDEFDSDFGFRGNVQFAFGLKDLNVFEFAGGQTNGFESDNESSASYTTPRTLPRFSNVSLVGPRRSDAITLPAGHRFEYSAVIRRGSQLSLYNSIIMGFPGGYSLRDMQSMISAQGDTLQARNISLQADGPLLPVHQSGTAPAGFSTSTWFNTTAYNNIGGTATRNPSAIGLVNMSNLNNPDPRPAPGSEPAISPVEFANLNLLAGGYFTPTTYRGAFNPALPLNQQWTAGWTNFDPQNANYTTSVKEVGSTLPSDFALDQNYPNPFNPTTNVRFNVPKNSFVTLKVYNMLGQEVATLVNKELNAGTFEADFNAANLASGSYVYRLTADGFVQSRKMILMK